MQKILLTLILCSLPLLVSGKTTCPSGSTECDSPCGSYIDMDDDGNCDHLPSTTQEKNITEKIKPETIQIKAVKKEIPIQKKKTIKPTPKETKTLKPLKVIPPKKTYQRKHYRLLPITISLFFLYILTIILYKKKIIEPRTHFKFWNFALLLTFLISALLGIFLVVMINYGIMLKLPFNILLWHTEAGIAMFIISLFHIHWHWRYIKNMFKIQK